jgi:2-dehydro-3-deoxygalactonokinase
MNKPYIAVDWGTSSFRAYHVDAEGKVINQFADAEGILSVKDKAFEAVLESHIGQISARHCFWHDHQQTRLD